MKGICFSGGGVKAAAHIGALKALEEEKIEFDCVSGASSGSIIATMYALGYNSDEMWELFQQFAHKIKYYQWKQILKLIIGLILKREIVIDGLNNGIVIENIIKDICSKNKVYNLNQIQMPLFISMVDMQTGIVYIASSKETRSILSDKTEYITDMSVGKAVRASCSYPVVFCPCEYRNLRLIDGGIRENLPWKCLKEIGAEEIWGITFNTIFNKSDCCSNIIEVAARTLELQGREVAVYEKQGIENLITINLEKVGLLDTKKLKELYKIGYKETKKQIKKYALH